MKKIVIGLLSLSLLTITLLGGFVFGYMASETNQSYALHSAPTPAIAKLNKDRIIQGVNLLREKEGLRPLLYDESLCSFAEFRLFQTHTNWSHEGYLPNVKRLLVYGYSGENLARGQTNESQLIEDWKNSPTHYKNIVSPNYARTCVATDVYTQNQFEPSTYTVQIFSN